MRPKLALAKTPHRRASAVEKPFVDRYRHYFTGTRSGGRMGDAQERTERERGLLKPVLQRCAISIFHHAGRQRFRSKRQIVTRANSATDKLDITAKRVQRSEER